MSRHATDFRTVQIGDVLPAPEGRGIWAADWEPAWFIFTVPPRGEMPASAWLARNGVEETWWPTETVLTKHRFKPGKTIPREKPICPGYLFAILPMRPHWDVLFVRSRKKLAKVVSHNGEPFPVPEAVIADMDRVPQRLEAIREAERAKRTIYPGDRAKVVLGEIEWQVEVSRIHRGIAHFVLPLLGGREVQAPVETLRKVQPLA